MLNLTKFENFVPNRMFIVSTLGMSFFFFGVLGFQVERADALLQDSSSGSEWEAIHASGMLFDGHNDLPWAMRQRAASSFENTDIAKPTPFHTDIPRLRKGGVKAQFWSVYVPAGTERSGNALLQTLEQIELVHEMCKTYPDVFEMADTAADIERIVADGKIASMIGVEGGHSIENNLHVLEVLYNKGARYMTLTHSKTLAWADSATDEPKNNGLSPIGKLVVREMNRLGMLVDLSHVSDKCMADAFEVTQAPVIYSHSSARAICDHPRNVSDDMLRKTAENGGVVMVNFMSGYVVPTQALEADKQARGNINTVCDHVEHIVKIAGIDHVGLGGDYDGVRRLPVGLEDVSCYPEITKELVRRGFTKEMIHKMLGGNVLRVLKRAEQVAAEMKQKETGTSEEGMLFELSLNANDVDRKGSIVKLLVDGVPEELKHLTLKGDDGQAIIGQLGPPSISSDGSDMSKRELTFVLPELAKGVQLKLKVYADGLNPHRKFEWHDDKYGTAQLLFGEQNVLSYMYEALDDSTETRRGETYKVFHHVYSPDGSRLITKGPGGLFPHHRGIYFGYNIIRYGDNQKADVWHCKNGAYQSHESTLLQIGGPVFGRDVNVIDWRGEDGKPFVRELRELTSYRIGNSTLIEFHSTLETLVGPVSLKGDPQHAGVQFRATQDVPDKTKGLTFYVRPDGKAKPGSFRNWSDKEGESETNLAHINLPWNAVCLTIPFDGVRSEREEPVEPVNRQITVANFDDPANPKPARYSERDYGRFGSYFEYELTEDNPLKVRYRFWIQDGEAQQGELARMNSDFTKPIDVKLTPAKR